MSRGYTSWSDNSNFLSFVDVTNECKKISPTGMVQPDCPLAEVYVTSISGTGSMEGVVAGNTASRRRRRLETAYPPAGCNMGSLTADHHELLPATLGVGPRPSTETCQKVYVSLIFFIRIALMSEVGLSEGS